MLQPTRDGKHRVVIIGGGFGGLNAAQTLRSAPVEVRLVDRRNFHLFQPLLYQVATGGLSPANIASPLRSILARQRNCETVLGEVVEFDVARRRVLLRDGALDYDSLIVAAGARTSYFGHEEWETLAPGLKTIEDATEIRRRILLAFEYAERETDPRRRRELMTFVIVGAGPTGVEMAGTMSEIAHYTLRHEFRHIDPRETRLIVVDFAPTVLSAYPPKLSNYAADSLRKLNVTVWNNTAVTEILPDRVILTRNGQEETIYTRNVLWAAGVQAGPLGRILAHATGAATDRAGRVLVEADCSVPGYPEIFVIGDMAHFAHVAADEAAPPKPLPGVAPVAIQQGRYVARLIARRLAGQPTSPFEYRDRGSMATIGRALAVAQLGKLQITGFVAWLMWLFIHLIQLVQFQSRILVLIQWAWNYVTFSRNARLITGHMLPIPKTDTAHQPPREPAEEVSIGANPDPHAAPPPPPAAFTVR